MAKQFEVGKYYEASDSGLDPIRILKRTKKTVLVWNGHIAWRMFIKHDKDGNEFVTDSSVPFRYRDEYTYSSKWCTT